MKLKNLPTIDKKKTYTIEKTASASKHSQGSFKYESYHFHIMSQKRRIFNKHPWFMQNTATWLDFIFYQMCPAVQPLSLIVQPVALRLASVDYFTVNPF